MTPARAAASALRWVALALAAAASVGCPSQRDGERSAASAAGELDVGAARQAVGAFAIAVVSQNRDEVKRVFSFRALAGPFKPKKVATVSPVLQARFNDEAMAQLLDPKGRVFRLVAGLEVGDARRDGRVVVVEGKSGGTDGGVLRFHVATFDGGGPRIIRIE